MVQFPFFLTNHALSTSSDGRKTTGCVVGPVQKALRCRAKVWRHASLLCHRCRVCFDLFLCRIRGHILFDAYWESLEPHSCEKHPCNTMNQGPGRNRSGTSKTHLFNTNPFIMYMYRQVGKREGNCEASSRRNQQGRRCDQRAFGVRHNHQQHEPVCTASSGNVCTLACVCVCV